MADVYLTMKGYRELEDKLNHLKSIRRQEISEKIKIAREFGDISENSEYDAAKDEQASVEGEIIEIENKLRTAKIIEDVTDVSVVTIGCRVKLRDIDNPGRPEIEYAIVGTTESNPFENRISNESPVGKAVLGKKTGDVVVVNAPKAKINMKITAISKS